MSTNELLYNVMLRSEGKELKMPILDAVCAASCLKLSALKGRSRKRELTEARQIAMYFLLRSGKSTTQSGDELNRDHSTAIHSYKRITNLYGQKSERKLTEMVDKISDLTGIRI